MTKYQVEGTQRWTRLDHGHELYCHGHLFQAAIAHRQRRRAKRGCWTPPSVWPT